jgi:hypothetical protein
MGIDGCQRYQYSRKEPKLTDPNSSSSFSMYGVCSGSQSRSSRCPSSCLPPSESLSESEAECWWWWSPLRLSMVDDSDKQEGSSALRWRELKAGRRGDSWDRSRDMRCCAPGLSRGGSRWPSTLRLRARTGDNSRSRHATAAYSWWKKGVGDGTGVWPTPKIHGLGVNPRRCFACSCDGIVGKNSLSRFASSNASPLRNTPCHQCQNLQLFRREN